jgi:hypothetical protein
LYYKNIIIISIIFIYVTKNPATWKTNIGKSSPISRKNIKEIIINVDTIIIIEEIVIVKGSLKSPKY